MLLTTPLGDLFRHAARESPFPEASMCLCNTVSLRRRATANAPEPPPRPAPPDSASCPASTMGVWESGQGAEERSRPTVVTALVAQARRLGLGEATVRRMRRIRQPEDLRAARGLLITVALVMTRHPQARGRHTDQMVREWLSVGRRAGARRVWETLVLHPGFWMDLGDSHRRLVARCLGTSPAPLIDLQKAVQGLLGDPRFRRADAATKTGVLRSLGACHRDAQLLQSTAEA